MGLDIHERLQVRHPDRSGDQRSDDPGRIVTDPVGEPSAPKFGDSGQEFGHAPLDGRGTGANGLPVDDRNAALDRERRHRAFRDHVGLCGITEQLSCC